MPELICEVCGSNEEVGTYQGYGYSRKLCLDCGSQLVAVQNAEERKILQANKRQILQVIKDKIVEIKALKEAAAAVPINVKEEIRRS